MLLNNLNALGILLALASVMSCATPISPDRLVLLDPAAPFGRVWNLSDQDRRTAIDSERQVCRDIFQDLPADEIGEAIDNCVGEVVFHQFQSPLIAIPPPLTEGSLRIVFYRDSGRVVEYAHVFGGYFASLPQLPEPERSKSERIRETEFQDWSASLHHQFGVPTKFGNWELFVGFQSAPPEESSCRVWVSAPVAYVLCDSRAFTVDASEVSLAMIRVDRLDPNSEMFKALTAGTTMELYDDL